MTANTRSSSDSLLPAPLTRLLRLLARGLGRLKRAILSLPAFRDIRDEVLHSEFTPEEQHGHETLVGDPVRMTAYCAAIPRNIKSGDVVVDLGTGTGILAMLAAQQGPRVVHAIDVSDIVSLSEKLARANGLTNIAFQRINSRRFTLDEPVDVILHEQIGEALIDEGMIEKTLDLKKRLLKKTGKILPGKFELFLEPACVKDGYRRPYLWETRFPGIDFSSAKPAGDQWRRSKHEWQVDARPAIDYFLGDAAPILTFDLNAIDDPAEVPQVVSASRTVRRAGRLDGFCLYFRVIFDAEVAFDTSPFSPRTVWDNLQVRVESREYREGETIAYRLDMTDRFDFETWTVTVG